MNTLLLGDWNLYGMNDQEEVQVQILVQKSTTYSTY